MKFLQKLESRMGAANSLFCVGLDPNLEKVPKRFLKSKDPYLAFNKWIINETHEYVCAYKPNSAFYESQGAKGIESLQKTCAYIQKEFPDIPIIIDAKRGDIGHTNKEYAKFIFEYLRADAVTLQPYLGSEALGEFFKYKNKGLIILCKTSNPGAGEFQDLMVQNGKNKLPFWKHVALEVATTWQKQSRADLLLVVGATYPKELSEIRKLLPGTTFLVPGVGAQGGSLAEILQHGLNKNKKGIIINSSREIIYSDDPRDSILKLWKNHNK